MKLFQIEEPDGASVDREAPGAAIGIDGCGAAAEVAVAVGGNAALLADRAGFERVIDVPAAPAGAAAWQALFEGARLRAERALARPVTHAVLALPAIPEAAVRAQLERAAGAAGIALLDVVAGDALAKTETPALAAAILAEERAPRPSAPDIGA